jgi:hypothetical protein
MAAFIAEIKNNQNNYSPGILSGFQNGSARPYS